MLLVHVLVLAVTRIMLARVNERTGYLDIAVYQVRSAVKSPRGDGDDSLQMLRSCSHMYNRRL